MGSMEIAIAAVRQTLANCPVFREIVGNEPLSRIHWRSIGADPAGTEEEYTREQLAEIRPCATLAHGLFSQESVAVDAWLCHGSVEVTVLQNIAEADLIGDCLVGSEAELRWIRQCDALLHEIRERVGHVLTAHTIRVLIEPGATSRDEMIKFGPFYGCTFEIQY